MKEEGVLRYNVPYPDHLSRLLIFIKWLLVIPHVIVLNVLGIAAVVVWVVAWLVVPITGNIPRGKFDFLVGVLRGNNRVITAYVWLLTDVYPPVSLSPTPTPPGAYAPYQPAYPA